MELRESLHAREVEPVPKPASFDPDAMTRALRIAGATLVVASASTFMMQHWQSGNDLGRYAMLVGQSLLLAAAAYFVGLTLREGRSARTFLALVLGFFPFIVIMHPDINTIDDKEPDADNENVKKIKTEWRCMAAGYETFQLS